MNIPLVDLARQNFLYQKKCLQVITKVIKKADFILGQEVADFEQSWAKYCHKKYCIGVNSGTDALFLSLKAYGIDEGDEVIVPPNTFFATAEAVVATGARVIFVDISPDTYTINPYQIVKKITNKTRVIIPVHLYGQPADMDSIIQIANKYHLTIIEDCCQAHGAKYKGKTVPVTETGAFSFYPSKNLGCFGDGGAVVTDNKKIAEKIKLWRHHGSINKYVHQDFGFNSRLDTIQAAVLRVKLSHLDQWNKLRRKHAQSYSQILKNIDYLKTPKEASYAYHVYHLYVVRAEKRDQLQKYLLKHGVSTIIHYPIPIHLQIPYRKLGYRSGDFPITEKLAQTIISLPLFPELTNKEIKHISVLINKFYAYPDLKSID